MSAEDLMRYLGVPLLFTLVVTLLITREQGLGRMPQFTIRRD